jgi:hypothetical protein
MSRHLHILATYLLTALYGMVGVWGGSLHYLLTEPGASQPGSRHLAATIYYHHHDNAGHWHIHHDQAQPSSSPGTRSTVHSGARDEPYRVSPTPNRPLHHPHSCALLTTVSKLKLGHGSYPVRLARPCRSGVVYGELAVTVDFQIDGLPLARGPPTRTIPT